MSLGEKKFFRKNRQCRRPRHLEKISKIEKFFFRASIQNGSKRRENKFGRKKIFFKKSSVSTTSILRKIFKNRKIFFSCIVFRTVQNVGKTSLSEKKFFRKNPLCVEDQNTWKKFQKSKKKFFAPRKTRLFRSFGNGSKNS